MKRAFLALVCLLTTCELVLAQTEVVGRYQRHDGMGGCVVEILKDGTFSYESYTDLMSAKTSGTWRLLAPGLVAASTDPAPKASAITVTRQAIEGTVVAVKDEEGRSFPGALVSLRCGEKSHSLRADAQGLVAVRDCVTVSAIAVSFDGFQTAGLDGPAARGNHFAATLELDVLRLSNALWYVHDAQLFELTMGIPRVDQAGGS